MNEMTDENSRLAMLAKSGDKDALEMLVTKNTGLVKSAAMRFTGRGTELEDLLQIGTIGMIKAAKRYDPSFGTVFSTYAVHMIIGEIKRFLRDDGLIKVSRETKKHWYIINKAREDFAKLNSREPTVSELSKLCGISAEKIAYASAAMCPCASLQEKCGDGDDQILLEAMIGSDDTDDKIERIALSEAINDLPENERELIELRYFRGLTQTQCARLLSVTQVKISRTEKKIIGKLKEKMCV